MNDLLIKRNKKQPLELQLTAMIDVFSMIVIFLIFGTVFGAADIVIPADMKIPKSVSKEGIESAPRVSILKNEITTSFFDRPITLIELRGSNSRAALKAKLAPALSSFLESKKKSKEPVIPVNLLADKETPYADVFDVTALFREMGFNTILFVAGGAAKPK